MNCNVTLTPSEFSALHNALWHLGKLNNRRVDEQVQAIRDALANAYKQEADDFNRKSEHYSEVRELLDLESVWSDYSVEDLGEAHPFTGAVRVSYEPFGGETVYETIEGSNWEALYVAADKCLVKADDLDHIYIEKFEVNPNEPGTLILYTGS